MNQIEKRQAEIVEEFQGFQDWEEKYAYIISLGKKLKGLDKEQKSDEALVKGCQSRVWLHAQKTEDGLVQFDADSDALIAKGLVALLLRAYSPASPQEIMSTAPSFVKELGLQSHLSPNRANGLAAMMKQIQFFAMAFSLKK